MQLKPSNSSISLDITEECNLRCSYCFTWVKEHKKKVLPYKLGTQIIDHWLKEGKKIEGSSRELVFWGGEPLLEWDLLKNLVTYAEKNKKDEQVIYGGTTNGTLYTPDKVEWCLENNALMLVSLDGIEKVHDHCRVFKSGEGSWKIVDKNIREALKITSRQMVRNSISVQSAPYLMDTLKYFVEDLGIKNFSFSPVYEDNWTEHDFEILEDQFSQMVSYLVKRRKQKKGVKVKHLDDQASIFGKSNIKHRNPCGAGNNYSGWSIEGIQFPCHRFNKHGRTKKEKMQSKEAIGYIDNNGTFHKLNEVFSNEFLNFTQNTSKHCEECDIFSSSQCHGGCYALNYDMTKDIHGKVDAECRFSHIQKKYGDLYAQELQKNGLSIKSNECKSCICYNMCYMEGTEQEIIHIDRQSDVACACYNTNYNHTGSRQYRTIKKRQERKNIVAEKLLQSLGTEAPEAIKTAVHILKEKII